MPDKNAHRREAPISYRPPKGREAEFYERFEKSGLSMNAFITSLWASVDGAPRRSRRPPVEAQLLAQLLGRAAQISDQLHEAGLAGGDTLLIEQAVGELAEIRAAILKLMGRKP